MSTAKHRVEALERTQGHQDAAQRPAYHVVNDESEITPEMRGKVFIGGISPDDWDTPEEPNHERTEQD